MPGKPKETLGTAPLLTDRRPVPPIDGSQLAAYNAESLHVTPAGRFNTTEARGILRKSEGQQVIGLDLGGGKAFAVLFNVVDGRLVPDKATAVTVEDKTGADFLPLFEQVSKYAEENGIPVGVSCAGVIEGAKLVQSPNVPAFSAGFQAEYGSDFTRLFPTVAAVNNDAEAAIKAATLNAGFEGEGQIMKMEPGHVELLDLKRPQGQTVPDEPCGMFGQEFVCVERAIGGVAGIESRWEKTTRESLDGRKISDLYQQGNSLATELYDTSATQLAIQIQGMGNTLGLTGEGARAGLLLPIIGGGNGGAGFVMDDPKTNTMPDLVVAFHGGVNNVPGYMDRVRHILGEAGTSVNSSFTERFSINAGAEGAAIAALMAKAAQN
jgi:predicted NBD/HSP70 family sugar kinase